MHLGNAQTALLAWLHAREHGGRFVLRIEDLDPTRARAGMEEVAILDLRWLGLDWDEGPDIGGPFAPYRQSERSATYQDLLARLPTYPCSCSRTDVRTASAAPHEGQTVTRYPGTCRLAPTRPDRPCAWRIVVPDGLSVVEDLVLGRLCDDVSHSSGDFVVRRADGAWAYNLAVVADDAAMQVTHVIRGEDLAPSALRQAVIYGLAGFRPPIFAHVPLRRDYQGQRLAKRGGAPSLAALRCGGADPTEVVAQLAAGLGWTAAARATPTDLIGRAGPYLAQLRAERADLSGR